MDSAHRIKPATVCQPSDKRLSPRRLGLRNRSWSSALDVLTRVLATAAVIAGLTSVASVSGIAGRIPVAAAAPLDPTVSCTTDPNIFNTGYDSATGGVLPNNSLDANWQVAGVFDSPGGTTPPTATSLPPPGTTFAAANVGSLAPGAWSASPYANAQWISQQTIANPSSPNGDWYYEYVFNLSASVEASTFSLAMNFLGDNDVATVFVNGVDQSTYPGSNLPQTATNPYNYVGYHTANAAATTLDHNWQTGSNTIIVQLKSGPPDEGFDAQMRPTAFCPVALGATKTASPDPYVPGSRLTYTVTVSNAGPGSVAEATVSDPLPSALAGAGFTWTCLATAGSLCTPSGSGNISDTVNVAADGILTYTVTGTVPVSTTGTLTNTVTVTPPSGVTDLSCTPNCTATSSDPMAAPGLSVVKSVTSSGPYGAVGQPIDYSFVVTNTGNVSLSGVGVGDVQSAPAGVLTSGPSCQGLVSPAGPCSGATTSLVPGQVATFVGVYAISQADLDNGSVHDTATASGDGPGCSSVSCATSSAGSSATVDVTQSPGLSVVKSSPTANYSAVGDTINYDFLVTNTGNVSLHAISVDDTESAPATQANLTGPTCPVSSLAPGDNETCTATYTVTQADLNNGSITDSATASGTPPGSQTPVTSGSSTFSVSALFAAVTLTKSASTLTPEAHTNDTFTLTASNAGPSSSGAVVVTDVLPAGLAYVSSTAATGTVVISGQTVTWTIPNLGSPVGAQSTLSIVVSVNTTAAVSNTATFTQTAFNGSGGHTGSSNTVTLTPTYAVIALSKTVSNHSPLVGSDVTYTITVKNEGPGTSEGVSVTDPLPSGLSFVSANESVGQVTTEGAGGTTVAWQVGTLANQASEVLHVVARVTASAGTIVNTAKVVSSTFDPNGQVETAAATATVAAASATTSASPTTVSLPHSGPLPFTGADAAWEMGLALIAGGFGCILLFGARRRLRPAGRHSRTRR